MITLKSIHTEFKYSVIFGLLALILSVLIGIVSNINFSIIVVRSLILTLLFSALGYGILYILKRFVPEVYELLPSLGSYQTSEEKSGPEEGYEEGGEPMMKTGEAEEDSIRGDAGKFQEMSENDFQHLSSTEGVNQGSAAQAKDGKLGKHIIEKQKIVMYEPKIMAQAIRTMMSKDQD